MFNNITITHIGSPIEKSRLSEKWIQAYILSQEPDEFWKKCYETAFHNPLIEYFKRDQAEALKHGLLPPDPHNSMIEHRVYEIISNEIQCFVNEEIIKNKDLSKSYYSFIEKCVDKANDCRRSQV